MGLRKHLKISVTPAAKAAVVRLAERKGMSEQAVASRFFEWFCAADPMLRDGILGVLPEGYEADVVRMAFERLLADIEAQRPAKPPAKPKARRKR